MYNSILNKEELEALLSAELAPDRHTASLSLFSNSQAENGPSVTVSVDVIRFLQLQLSQLDSEVKELRRQLSMLQRGRDSDNAPIEIAAALEASSSSYPQQPSSAIPPRSERHKKSSNGLFSGGLR